MINNKMQSVLILEGTPYDRGLLHGQTLKTEIHEIIALWRDNMSNSLKIDIDKYIKHFLEKTDFLSYIKTITPDLFDELKGISAGSGINFDTIYAFQLMDEMWLDIKDKKTSQCSSIGFNPANETPTCIAQNLDIESFRNNYQIVFHIKNLNDKLETFVLSCPGLIGFNGMNSGSIGICCNSLSPLKFSNSGLPVAFVIRGILEQGIESKVIEFITNIKHASGQNYLIGTGKSTFDFECSTNKVVEYRKNTLQNYIFHTNHPLINDDYSVPRDEVDNIYKQPKYINSVKRFEYLKNRLEKLPQENRLTLLKNTLMSKDSAEHPIASTIGDGGYYSSRGSFTFASTIMVLSDTPKLYINFAPVNIDNYEILEFTNSNLNDK